MRPARASVAKPNSVKSRRAGWLVVAVFSESTHAPNARAWDSAHSRSFVPTPWRCPIGVHGDRPYSMRPWTAGRAHGPNGRPSRVTR